MELRCFYNCVLRCRRLKVVVAVLLAVLLVLASTGVVAQAPGGSALIFRADDTFDSYIKRSIDTMEKTPNGTEVEREYAHPFVIPPNEKCTQYTGFLLLHGLAVNPSNMRDISQAIQERYDCVLIFAPIMPGHGTTLEDVVKVSYQDWVASTENAYRYLKKHSPHKTVVMGYSTGGTLTLNLLGDLDASDYPDAVVLFAPGTLYKKRMEVLLSHLLHWLSIDYYPQKLSETNPFETRTSVVNELVQFSVLALVMRSKMAVVSDEIQQVPMVIIAAKDDDVIDTKATVRLLDQDSFDSSIYLIPPTVDSGDRTNSITSGSEDGADSKTFTTRWSHHSHTGITIRPDNPFINSKNFYCWYTPAEEIESNTMIAPGFVDNSRDDIKTECIKNLTKWSTGNSLDTGKKTYRPAENQHFDEMMNEIVHPFLNRVGVK